MTHSLDQTALFEHLRNLLPRNTVFLQGSSVWCSLDDWYVEIAYQSGEFKFSSYALDAALIAQVRVASAQYSELHDDGVRIYVEDNAKSFGCITITKEGTAKYARA